MILKIIQDNDPQLRQISRPLSPAEISSAETLALLKSMSETLDQEPDGIALAAPQVGTPLRIFIVSGKLHPDKDGRRTADRVFINPSLKKVSQKKAWKEEGCLSVRYKYGQIKRAEKVTVEACSE